MRGSNLPGEHHLHPVPAAGKQEAGLQKRLLRLLQRHPPAAAGLAESRGVPRVQQRHYHQAGRPTATAEQGALLDENQFHNYRFSEAVPSTEPRAVRVRQN